MVETCDHSVGHLTAQYDSDEAIGSKYDLAADFANDETFVIYAVHHDMAKEARAHLSQIATGLREHMKQIEQGEQ